MHENKDSHFALNTGDGEELYIEGQQKTYNTLTKFELFELAVEHMKRKWGCKTREEAYRRLLEYHKAVKAMGKSESIYPK